MRVLITGVNGFLGNYLTHLLIKRKHSVIATGKGECRLTITASEYFQYHKMDFTNDQSVAKIFTAARPEVIVHAGAISKPNECELHQDIAYKINVEGTKILLKHAADQECHFVFLSSDFVFDGIKGMYKEDDAVNPVNFYGKTKVEAEKFVKQDVLAWSIVRTVLVYGNPLSGKDNLLTVVKKKLENGEVFRVFNDQVRTPTYIEDLAAGIVSIIEERAKGIYHLSGKDVLTPYEMALKTAVFLGLDQSLLKKATVSDFSEPAKKPLKTGFVIDKAKKELGFNPVSFEEGLKKTFL